MRNWSSSSRAMKQRPKPRKSETRTTNACKKCSRSLLELSSEEISSNWWSSCAWAWVVGGGGGGGGGRGGAAAAGTAKPGARENDGRVFYSCTLKRVWVRWRVFF